MGEKMIKQFLTCEGRWCDFRGWNWNAVPNDERRYRRMTSNDRPYYMCDLARGTIRTTAWIDASGARIGATVRMEDGDLWMVVQVSDIARPKSEIDSRSSFGSLA